MGNTLKKFWNMNARPYGRLGRITLRMMNLTHTPMAKWNLSLINFKPGWTILDVGCGGGKNISRMLRISPESIVYGIDYSEGSVDMSIKKNQKYIGSRCFIEHGNALQMSFDDSKFDLVTAYETVYFWPDLPRAFSEVYRVLKSEGIFTFSYGEESNPTMRYWANEIEAMRLLPLDDISRMLYDAGFTDCKITKKGSYTVNFLVRKTISSCKS